VVEHSIGNGEVDSSILSGSTSFSNEINISVEPTYPLGAEFWHMHAERSMKLRALACKIRAACSPGVLIQIWVLACFNP
jgi:hypothetical protein